MQYRSCAFNLANCLHARIKQDDFTDKFLQTIPTQINDDLTQHMQFLFSRAPYVSKLMNWFLSKHFSLDIVGKFREIHDWAYASVFDSFATFLSPLLSRDLCADVPHVKRKLRHQYVKQRGQGGYYDLMVRRLSAKIKSETAKYGKAPRLFISYDSGSMYQNELPEMVKVCLDGTHYFPIYGNIYINLYVRIVGKPKCHDLSDDFNWFFSALTGKNVVHVLIYSDDSCYCGSVNGESFCFNVDVSSNDSSQTTPAFLCVYEAMRSFNVEAAQGLLKQCLLPIRVQSPDSSEFFDVKFDSFFEGSGTVLTTILNHFGSLMIAIYSVVCMSSETMSFQEAIVNGGIGVGHKVSIFDCCVNGFIQHERLQFLKYSPVLSECGTWVAVANIGSLLRSLGTLEGDLLPSTLGFSVNQVDLFNSLSWDERMCIYISAIINGYKNHVSHPILDALRARFCRDDFVIDSSDVVTVEGIKHTASPIRVDSWMRRYSLTRDELDELIADICTIRLGRISTTRAMAKILNLDYEVPLCSFV